MIKENKFYYSDGTTSNEKDSNKILHRDGDLPAVECDNWYKAWRKEGKLHRDNDLPAVEWTNEYKAWNKEGELHRLTGPARIWSDGYVEYWIEGKKYTKEQFHKIIANM